MIAVSDADHRFPSLAGASRPLARQLGTSPRRTRSALTEGGENTSTKAPTKCHHKQLKPPPGMLILWHAYQRYAAHDAFKARVARAFGSPVGESERAVCRRRVFACVGLHVGCPPSFQIPSKCYATQEEAGEANAARRQNSSQGATGRVMGLLVRLCCPQPLQTARVHERTLSYASKGLR